jgi:hypothetical protein
MADVMTCPTCGTPDQEVGKFCEQCGGKVERADTPDQASADVPPADPVNQDAGATADLADSPALDGYVPATQGMMRFIRLENGVLNRDQSFDVPLGATLLVGRTDPMGGVFPEVDVTMWSRRVRTPEGELYTIHRRQCFISRDPDGRVRIRDCPEYIGDTMVSPVGTAQFRPIPALADEREADDDGAIVLEVGDRILMGQGEGMLIFQLMQV